MHNETFVKDNLHVDAFSSPGPCHPNKQIKANIQLCMHKEEASHVVPMT